MSVISVGRGVGVDCDLCVMVMSVCASALIGAE